MYPSIFFSPWLKSPTKEGVIATGEKQGTRPSKYNSTNEHMKSQKLCSLHITCMGMYLMGFQPERKGSHKPTSLNESLSSIDNHLKMNN